MKYLVILLLVTACAPISHDEYSKPLFKNECTFRPSGEAVARPCADYRIIKEPEFDDLAFTEPAIGWEVKYFYKVSDAEKWCFRLTRRYVQECVWYPSKTVYTVIGVNENIERHAYRHTHEGNFHL